MNISVTIEQTSPNEQAALEILLSEANGLNERSGIEPYEKIEDKFVRDIREQINYHAQQVSSDTLVNDTLASLSAEDQKEVIELIAEKASLAGKPNEHLRKRLGL